MLTTRRNFLDGPSDDDAIFLNMRGAGFRYRKISSIEPSRWHFSESRAEDVAWIELTEAERESFAGAKGLPVLAWIGEGGVGYRAVNETQMRFRLGVNVGAEVETVKLSSMTDMRFPYSCVLPFPCCKLVMANAYESGGKVEQLDFSTNVNMCNGGTIRMRMHRIGCSSKKNNSGSPVLFKDNVIGLIVAANEEESAFQCLDPILEHYGIDN